MVTGRDESLGTQDRKVELWIKKKVRVGIQGPACPLGPPVQVLQVPRGEGQRCGDKPET